MSKIHKLKRFARQINITAMVFGITPLLVALTACGTLNVEQKADQLASRNVTVGRDEAIFPDATPSTADGSVYWKQQNCAVCHGDGGKGVPGKCDVDLTNVDWMRGRKPTDQYLAIAFGEGKDIEMPVLSAGTESGDVEPVVKRTFQHTRYSDKLTRRQLWDLVFYTRALAVPLLSKEERAATKVVFGGNCAVCHGARGAGDGDLNKGLVLQPAPANFNKFKRFYDRTDDQLFDHIANGIKWEGMPNFLGKEDKAKGIKFDPPYIWKLVQYVRNFHEDALPALETAQATAAPAGAPTEAPAAPATSTTPEPAKTEEKSPADGEKEAAPAGKEEGAKTESAPPAPATNGSSSQQVDREKS
ncbi:MAG: c-type cytochrome [Cyanobacteria bacterium]|nr:c-type cytochrome [Cyanobacteriota bacterium]